MSSCFFPFLIAERRGWYWTVAEVTNCYRLTCCFIGPKLPPESYYYVYRAVQRRPFNDKTVEILSLPQKYRMCRLHRPPRFGKTTALAMLDLFNDISTPDEYIERAFKVCLVVCSQSPLQRCKIHHFTTGHASVGNRLDGEEKILLYHPSQLPSHW